jgi:hypothetical protein
MLVRFLAGAGAGAGLGEMRCEVGLAGQQLGGPDQREQPRRLVPAEAGDMALGLDDRVPETAQLGTHFGNVHPDMLPEPGNLRSSR